jgi:septum formation protein
MRVILASASPRRRELLAMVWPVFEVAVSGVEETLGEGGVASAVEGLAVRKAVAVARGMEDAVVIGADTVVVIEGDVLGKPESAAAAARMLRRLRGRVHEVVTGVAVVVAPPGAVRAATVVSRVLMADYDDGLVDAYVASGAPLDKAGGYAIQDLDGALVVGVVGSYTNVIGLPLAATRALLAGAGLPVSAPAAA